MPKYTVKLGDVIVGHADFDFAATEGGTIRAPFRSGLGYELIEPILSLRYDAMGTTPPNDSLLERYHAARGKLVLVLADVDGAVVPIRSLEFAREGNTIVLELVPK